MKLFYYYSSLFSSCVVCAWVLLPSSRAFVPRVGLVTTTPSTSTTSTTQLDAEAKKRVVVVGNGMVGQRFLENMLDLGLDAIQLSTFCEEPRAAYNRVKVGFCFVL